MTNMIFNKNLPCKLHKGGFRRAVIINQLCEGRVRSDEDFVREACAEAEAGDEAVEAVGVDEICGGRKVLLEVRPLRIIVSSSPRSGCPPRCGAS